jgi:hypothetical protein
MKPTPDCACGAPLKGAIPADWQSQIRGIPGMGCAGFMRSAKGN